MGTRHIHDFGTIVQLGATGLIVLLLVTFTSCAPPAPPAEPTPTPAPGPSPTLAPTPGPVGAQVSMQNLAYSPSTVTIKQGQSVLWTNTEPSPVDHTVTSGTPEDPNAGSQFDSGLIAQGKTYSFTFNTPGDYIYFCRLHFTMGMRDAHVIVTAGP